MICTRCGEYHDHPAVLLRSTPLDVPRDPERTWRYCATCWPEVEAAITAATATNTAAAVKARRMALVAFVRAYGNVDRLDDDAMQVALFTAWLAAVDALGIVAEIPPHAQALAGAHTALRFGPGGADDLRREQKTPEKEE
jgi:hypothetical protein